MRRPIKLPPQSRGDLITSRLRFGIRQYERRVNPKIEKIELHVLHDAPIKAFLHSITLFEFRDDKPLDRLEFWGISVEMSADVPEKIAYLVARGKRVAQINLEPIIEVISDD